jgi:GDP-mannose 6-dehydrogenase
MVDMAGRRAGCAAGGALDSRATAGASRAVAVVGLGHVGSVAAACLALRGHRVIAVDRDERRVAAIEAGRPPVDEPRLAAAVAAARQTGRLSATTSLPDAVGATRASLVCVGTPGLADGAVDLRDLQAAVAGIAAALTNSAGRHVIVIRSTVPPGTTQAVARSVAERSGRVAGRDFGVCANPEFLREGSAVDDFDGPQPLVIGETDRRDGDLVLDLERAHHARSVLRCAPATAELLKYLHNGWNALRVSFANEVGAAASALGVEAPALLAAFSGNATGAMTPGYLAPGGPWGGACLRKDLAALRYVTAQSDVAAPLLDAIQTSNEAHLRRCVAGIEALAPRRVAIIGLAFKPGTADVRDSPFVALAERLAAQGAQVRVFDPLVADADLSAALRERRDATLAAIMAGTDLAVVCHGDTATRTQLAPLARDARQVDLSCSPLAAASADARGHVAAA